MRPEPEVKEAELELDSELEELEVTDEDCTEEFAGEVFVVVEISEVEGCAVGVVVEVWEGVEVVVLWGNVRT